MGPAKPTRKLPEAERKALLSQESPTLDHDPMSTSQDHDHDDSHEEDCPMSQLIDQSTDSVENNLSDNALNHSNEALSVASDANSLSWDYASRVEVEKRQREEKTPDRQEKARSFPAASTKAQQNFTLDLVQDDLGACAPLASPETLSDISSIDSGSWKGSRKGFSNGYQRLTTGMPTMEPIPHSPLKHARSDGYHYFISAPSPVDYAESPEQDDFESLSTQMTAPLAQSTPMKNTMVTEATVESDETDRSSPPKPPRTALDMDTFASQDDNAPQARSSTEPSFDMTAEEVKLQEKIAKFQSPDNYKLTFDDELQNSSLDSYVRHSPDSYGNQMLYDFHKDHYTHAGRGYPHGGYLNEDLEFSLNGDKIQKEEDSTLEKEVENLPNCSQVMEQSKTEKPIPEKVEGGSNGKNNGNNNDPLKPEVLLDISSAPDIIVTNGDHQARPRLEPFKSNDRAKSSSPEDEFGKRLTQAVSDDVFLPDGLQNVHESHV